MRATDLRRWHWMILGLTLGFIGGSVRSACMNFADELTRYDAQRIGQRDFERAVAARIQGRPGFMRLAVQPYRLAGSSAGAVTVHVVSGLYCDGTPTEENGRRALQWKPAYFVASAPYRPLGAQGAAFVDVGRYLNSVGAPYAYTAWWWATRPPFVWTCAGFLLVGVVWPTAVTLLAYGTLTRPPEPKAASLPKSTTPPPAVPKPTDVDLQAVHDLDRQLEESLLQGASGGSSAAAVATITAAPRALAAEPLQPTEAHHGPQKEFGAKREDYYPTELSAKHDA